MKKKILAVVADVVIAVAASAIFWLVAPYFVKMYLGSESLLDKGAAFVSLVFLGYGLYLAYIRILKRYPKR